MLGALLEAIGPCSGIRTTEKMVTNEENTRRNERNLCGQVIQNGATKEGSALCPLGVGKGMQLVGWDP